MIIFHIQIVHQEKALNIFTLKHYDKNSFYLPFYTFYTFIINGSTLEQKNANILLRFSAGFSVVSQFSVT